MTNIQKNSDCSEHGGNCSSENYHPPIFTPNQSLEEIKEQLLADPEFIKGIKEGVTALKEGKITPWEEVRKELGIE